MLLPTLLSTIPISPARLEPAPQRQHQMQRRSTLEIVLRCHLVVRPLPDTQDVSGQRPNQPPAALSPDRYDSHLLPTEDQPLLHGWDTLFLLNPFLYT